MKGTENFKKVIEAHLLERANEDPLFQLTMQCTDKNLDDCVTYILNQVKESGANGFTDDEIFGMAVHYYDEKSIDIGAEIKMEVIVNHKVELTAEEIAEAKQKAIDDVINEQRKKMTAKPVQKPKEVQVEVKPNEPLTLF